MADDLSLRSCGRAGCHWPAAASLSFRYATREVWLADLSPEPDPALYDLCPHHADSLTVPRGWERVDERRSAAVVAEPAGRDLDPEAGGTPPGSGGYGRNRYAALTAALPRLARELHGEAGPEAASARPEGSSADRARSVVPSRELAPVPTEGLPAAPAEPSGTGPGDGGGGTQLALPDPDGDADGGVVVPLEAGARRRT